MTFVTLKSTDKYLKAEKRINQIHKWTSWTGNYATQTSGCELLAARGRSQDKRTEKYVVKERKINYTNEEYCQMEALLTME